MQKIDTREQFLEAVEIAVFKDAALPALTREYIHDAQRDRETERHLEHREVRKHVAERD